MGDKPPPIEAKNHVLRHVLPRGRAALCICRKPRLLQPKVQILRNFVRPDVHHELYVYHAANRCFRLSLHGHRQQLGKKIWVRQYRFGAAVLELILISAFGAQARSGWVPPPSEPKREAPSLPLFDQLPAEKEPPIRSRPFWSHTETRQRGPSRADSSVADCAASRKAVSSSGCSTAKSSEGGVSFVEKR
jgi:hypothetical protein